MTPTIPDLVQTKLPPGWTQKYRDALRVPLYTPAPENLPITLMWLDFETTGLNTEQAVITEVGVAFTCAAARPVHSFGSPVAITFEQLQAADPWVKDNLALTLQAALMSPFRLTSDELDIVLSCWLRYFGSTREKPTIRLAGNSVWFDRAFLRRQLPNTYQLLHYRQLDVSSVEMFLQNTPVPSLQARLPFPKQKQHKALCDVEESLAQYRHYRGLLLEDQTSATGALLDEIRAQGWSVTVHNDYRLHGEPHTFWEFSKDDFRVKGEGRNDAVALNLVRSEIRRVQGLMDAMNQRSNPLPP